MEFYNFGRYIGNLPQTQQFVKEAEENHWSRKQILEDLEVEQNNKRRKITKWEYGLLRLGAFPDEK